MSRLTRTMSPAALIISVLALIVATSATSAYAATKIGTNQLKSNAVTSPKIKSKTIKVSDLASSTVATLRGQTGPQGAPGRNGSARAYASVTPGGTLLTARTSGFTSATRTGTGVYCLTLDPALGIDTSKITAIAGIEWGQSTGNNLSAYWYASGCAAGQVSVLTYTFAAGANNVPNNAAFSVVVP